MRFKRLLFLASTFSTSMLWCLQRCCLHEPCICEPLWLMCFHLLCTAAERGLAKIANISHWKASLAKRDSIMLSVKQFLYRSKILLIARKYPLSVQSGTVNAQHSRHNSCCTSLIKAAVATRIVQLPEGNILQCNVPKWCFWLISGITVIAAEILRFFYYKIPVICVYQWQTDPNIRLRGTSRH